MSIEKGFADEEENRFENEFVSVPGFLEIFCAIADITPCTSKNNDNLQKVAKTKKKNQIQKWNKEKSYMEPV